MDMIWGVYCSREVLVTASCEGSGTGVCASDECGERELDRERDSKILVGVGLKVTEGYWQDRGNWTADGHR